jgi:pimeloyl-ACP methyl ester carboxylesterase
MTTFVLIPGAGGVAAYWGQVVPFLEREGHLVIAPDLPGDDDTKGLSAYADIVVAAIGDRSPGTRGAQSMGGFTAALVAARVPIERLVFVNAMIPSPNETAGAWWGNTRSEEARRGAARAHGYAEEFDLATYFLHDLPEDVAKFVASDTREESKISFTEPARFERWPEAPVDVVIGRDDRFFPESFQKRVAEERLGTRARVREIPGGHLAALSHPRALADVLLAP